MKLYQMHGFIYCFLSIKYVCDSMVPVISTAKAKKQRPARSLAIIRSTTAAFSLYRSYWNDILCFVLSNVLQCLSHFSLLLG